MKESESTPRLGQFVQVKRGRDTGQFAVVVQQIDKRFVFIADGHKRTFDRPKKKNIQHLHCFDFVSMEIRNSIMETGRVTSKKLRWAVGQFVDETLEDLKKGDGFDCQKTV